MSKLLHIKGSRVKVLSSLPTNSFGDDGDIVRVERNSGIYEILFYHQLQEKGLIYVLK